MQYRHLIYSLWFVVSLVLFAGCSSTGKELEKIPPTFQKQEHDGLVLRGIGVKNIFMIKILKAGFYLPTEISSDNALDVKVPKLLSVLFFGKFSSKDFTNFTISHMKPNLTREEFYSLKDQLIRMGDLFPNIKVGDTMVLSYMPGEGTSFIHNGQIRGVIEGEIFSKAIFSTWIGSKPIDSIVKRNILGLAH